MHEMCRPRFDYNGVEHGSMKKKAKAPTSNTFTKALEVVAKKFQEELVAFRASADALNRGDGFSFGVFGKWFTRCVIFSDDIQGKGCGGG